ncbi:hypothetical protein Ddc_14198 [Ditylenchus destructor]|nr:hypothetical protein Ddc_14198 [Ditylenchus destructor]
MYVKSSDGTELSNDEIQQRLDNYYTVKIDLENGVLNATAIRNENINVPSNQQLSISFVIDVASETVSTELKTSGGNLIVRNIFGNTKAQSSGGNVEATNCGGENNALDLSTSGGDLHLNNLTGIINARTSGGSIVATTLTGDVTVRTSGGNLKVYDVSGALSATTSGGNIVVSMAKVTAGTQLKTTGGSVDLSFPPGPYDLTFSGNTVDVSGLNNFTGTHTKKEVKGQMNGGGTSIGASGNSVTVKITNEVISRTNGGDIFVVGNASLSEHKVEMYVKSNDGTELSNDEIQQRLDTYYTVKIDFENGVLNATAIRNESINVPSNQQLSMSFVINVASETVSTELNTGGGNLIVRRIFGNIKGQTFGGNAEVTNCGGENNAVDLSTSDGDLHLNNLTGTINARTSGGSIVFSIARYNHFATIIFLGTMAKMPQHALTGNIIVGTLNGNLNLYDVSGELSATSTLGGNIVSSMTKVTGDTRLMTYSGNVDFSFPSGHYNLTFIGNKVDVSGLNNFNGTQTQETKKLVNGQLNGGGTENAAIFASILGIVASEVIMEAKIFVFILAYSVNLSYMADVILFFISSLFFFLAFHGLKKERESIVLIFIFAQGIILFFMGTHVFVWVCTLIVAPGCERYWPFAYLTYCGFGYDALIFQYTAYGTIIYFVMSCALYWTIWSGYKFLKMANVKREISHVPIPAVCNTSNVNENHTTSNALPSTYHRSYEQQNQSPGGWPTFIDHQKCVEHERNILTHNIQDI